MTDIALLPCPFCGRKAELHTNQIAEDAAIAFVMCSACFAATDNLEDAYAPTGEAIAAWNRRASPSQVAAANPAQGVEQTWQKPGERAAQGTPADEQSGETGHVADDGQPDEAQEWHDYDPDC